MNNRCSFCGSTGKDVVCWECFQEETERLQGEINRLKERLLLLEKHVEE